MHVCIVIVLCGVCVLFGFGWIKQFLLFENFAFWLFAQTRLRQNKTRNHQKAPNHHTIGIKGMYTEYMQNQRGNVTRTITKNYQHSWIQLKLYWKCQLCVFLSCLLYLFPPFVLLSFCVSAKSHMLSSRHTTTTTKNNKRFSTTLLRNISYAECVLFVLVLRLFSL